MQQTERTNAKAAYFVGSRKQRKHVAFKDTPPVTNFLDLSPSPEILHNHSIM